MIRKFVLILWLAIGISTFAKAGYRDLKNAFDTYKPSAYYHDQFRPAPEREKLPIEEKFAEEKKRIEDIKSRWEKSLAVPEDEVIFLHPDPKRLSSLESAEMDVKAVSAALKNTFSFKTLEVLALLRSPGIRAAENRFRGAIEAFTQVSELDEILRQYTAFTEELKTGVGSMKGKEPMKLKFPFPGVLSLKAQVVNFEVSAERESLEAARRDAVTSIRKAYWDLVYVLKSKRITTEMVALLQYLEAVANTRYQAGKTNYQDVIKVRINRETLEEDLITLNQRQRNIDAKIREILNLSPEVKLGTPEVGKPSEKIPSLQNLHEIAYERRQELRRLRAKVGKMERMIEMAETMILPPYTLNLSVYEDEAVNMVGSFAKKDSFPNTTLASKGAGLPKMPWYGTEDAYLRETRKKLDALREDLKKAELSTQTMVRNAWFELDKAKRETILYQGEIVKLSRSALDVSNRGYEAGDVTFADVIDSYTIWLKTNLTLERNRSDLGIAWAELEQVVGMSFR